MVFYPGIAHAQDSNTSTTEQPTPLRTGESAPFNGVLIPTLQAAEMTARLEQQEAQCNLRVQTEVQRALSQKQLLLDNCNSARQTYEEMYRTQLASQREYIDFLEKKSENRVNTGPHSRFA